MSRVGKKPILIPEGVVVSLEGNIVEIKGPKGNLSLKITPEIKVEIKDGQVFVLPFKRTKHTNELHGTTRALIYNRIKGVTQEFEKKLEIQGIGYKASIEGQDLVLNVGFTHQVKIKPENDVKFKVEKNIITVSGLDKEKVTQMASKIKKVRPPEPYKGKGIRYEGEIFGKPQITVLRADGTYSSSIPITLPSDAKKGKYSVITTVQSSYASDSKEMSFQIR